MFLIARWIEGLLAAHAFLSLCLLLGLVVVPWSKAAANSRAQALLRIIGTCGLGFSVIGFLLFALGIAGLLAGSWIVIGIIAIAAIGAYINRSRIFTREYWGGVGQALVEGFDLPVAVVWATLILIALPYTFPVFDGDAISYHFAYAVEWARAGRIAVDPFLRFPFYANGFLPFYSAFMIFGGASIFTFALWSTSLLTALGVLAGSRFFLERTLPGLWSAVIGLALTYSVVFSFAFLRWPPQGYIDIALGALALTASICLVLALSENDRKWLVSFAVTAGFLIGMKGSYLLLLPVFGTALAIVARQLQISKRYLAGVAALLLVCSLPWYVRNEVMTGDPIPPVLNLALRGQDGTFTKPEWASLQNDLRTDRSPLAIFTLPFRVFSKAEDQNFRDWSVSALFLLLYVAPIAVLFQLLFRASCASAAVIAVLLLGFVVYYIATSTLVRYSMLFYPILAVCVAAAAAPLLKGRGFSVAAAVSLALLTIWPSPSSRNFLDLYDFNQFNLFDARYQDYPGDDACLRSHTHSGYAEEEFTTALMRANAIQGRVYTVFNSIGSAGPSFYYRRDGYTSIGDWFGPAAYQRLTAALQTGNARAFLDDLDVVALVIPSDSLGGIGVPLERVLEKAHFCDLPIPETTTTLEIRYSGSCGALVARSRKLMTSAL